MLAKQHSVASPWARWVLRIQRGTKAVPILKQLIGQWEGKHVCSLGLVCSQLSVVKPALDCVTWGQRRWQFFLYMFRPCQSEWAKHPNPGGCNTMGGQEKDWLIWKKSGKIKASFEVPLLKGMYKLLLGLKIFNGISYRIWILSKGLWRVTI